MNTTLEMFFLFVYLMRNEVKSNDKLQEANKYRKYPKIHT